MQKPGGGQSGERLEGLLSDPKGRFGGGGVLPYLVRQEPVDRPNGQTALSDRVPARPQGDFPGLVGAGQLFP